MDAGSAQLHGTATQKGNGNPAWTILHACVYRQRLEKTELNDKDFTNMSLVRYQPPS